MIDSAILTFLDSVAAAVTALRTALAPADLNLDGPDLSRFRIPPVGAVRVGDGWDVTGDGKADFDLHPDVVADGRVVVGTFRGQSAFWTDGTDGVGNSVNISSETSWRAADKDEAGCPATSAWLVEGGWSYSGPTYTTVDYPLKNEVADLGLPPGTYYGGSGFWTVGDPNAGPADVELPDYPARNLY